MQKPINKMCSALCCKLLFSLVQLNYHSGVVGTDITGPAVLISLLECRGNYSGTSNQVHWPLIGGLLHLIQR